MEETKITTLSGCLSIVSGVKHKAESMIEQFSRLFSDTVITQPDVRLDKSNTDGMGNPILALKTICKSLITDSDKIMDYLFEYVMTEED